MSKADSGHIMPEDTKKPSRRRALSLISGAVPVLTASYTVAATASPLPTSLFLEILAASQPAQAALYGWGDCIHGTQDYTAAEERSNAADKIHYDLIRRYIAEVFANPSWHHVGELAAIQRHEWWDKEGRIGEPSDPWIERALMDLVEKVSGMSSTVFRRGRDV